MPPKIARRFDLSMLTCGILGVQYETQRFERSRNRRTYGYRVQPFAHPAERAKAGNVVCSMFVRG